MSNTSSALAAGNDDLDLDVNDMAVSLEKAIAHELCRTTLTPLTRLAMDGHNRSVRPVHLRDDSGAEVVALVSSKSPPLEFMHLQAKNKIAVYQYAAGCRFRMDYEMSRLSDMGAIDPSQMGLFAVEDVIKGIGGRVRAAKRGKSPGVNISDVKLDAQARLGEALDVLGRMSYYFLEKIAGDEISLGSMARCLEVPEQFISHRFREALDDAARHYSLLHMGTRA